jgi:deoxyuridine 5'-triphosphate nucleotidohydrolase
MQHEQLVGEHATAEIEAHASHIASIVIELLHEDAEVPLRATQGSAGYDLFAYLKGQTVDCSDGQRQWKVAPAEIGDVISVALPAGAMALIPLGFKARLPNGYEAQVRPRSGAAFKKGLGIPNAPGTIDADFPDEWRVIVRNMTAQTLEIAHGERIAQWCCISTQCCHSCAGRSEPQQTASVASAAPVTGNRQIKRAGSPNLPARFAS